jgi:D-beta-D-heptose 7-phosphate kinase / D-beta-D-heptose 1-phosphate adenosyltransferase
MTRGEPLTSSVVMRLSTVRVAVVGDIMLDVWIDGPVRRISPEAPVAIVDVTSRLSRLGGAANVAGLVGVLGAGAPLLGVIGDDETGAELSSLVGSATSCSLLVCDASRRSTRKTRIVSNGQQVCRLDEEDRISISVDVEDQLLNRMDDAFDNADAVIISDYGKGVVTDRIADEVIVGAQRRGLAVIVDPSGGDAFRFSAADIVKPNRLEALAAVGLAPDVEMPVLELASLLRARLGDCDVLVTDGRHGIGVASADGAYLVPGIPREVADVTGAGDAVAAVVALAVGAGLELETVARMGNAAGAVAVSKWGTAPFALNELLDVFNASSE